MNSLGIPAQVTIPVVGSKVDTKQVFIWAVLIIGAYILITKGIPAIVSAVKNGVYAGINAVGGALGNDASASSTYQSASAWCNNYLDNMGKNDPFGTSLYSQYAAQSNLDYPTLVVIARSVRASMGTGFLGIKISSGVESDFQKAFQSCLSQTDVSNVSVVYSELYDSSNMMHDAIRDTVLLVNLPDYNSDGSIMSVALQKFIQQVNKLPIS